MGYAAIAMKLTDKAEEQFGMVPTEKDKEELKTWLPTIRTVEREERR
jgi:hypothetical protein